MLALGVCVCAHAETRYVSHSGSNTAPYTTWETAANTIEAANLAMVPGDTMFIDTGSYYVSAIVYTEPKITLRGKGMDSTHILPSQPLGALFLPEDSTYVCDLHFDGLYNVSTQLGTDYAFAKLATDPWRTFVCHRCKFSRFKFTPISFNKMVYVEIKDCWFEDWDMYALSLTERGDYVIENNTFDATRIQRSFFDFMFATGDKYVRNNIFLGGSQGGIEGGTAGRMEMTNNLFYKNMYLPDAVSVGEHELLFANNSLYMCHPVAGSGTVLLIFGDSGVESISIYNNIIVDYEPHILFRYAYPATADVRVTHNCFFATNPEAKNDFIWADGGAVLPDSVYANIIGDPMYVDPVNGNLHLQASSPAIDAGVPWVLDVDGTRSDMGAFGGPGGTIYTYVDYPPNPPSELSSWRDGRRVILSWYRNRESDFHHYILFRSEQSPVELDSASVLAYLSTSGEILGESRPGKHLLPVGERGTLPDRSLYDGYIPIATAKNLVSIFYCDDNSSINNDYYYALVAVDSSGLVSTASTIAVGAVLAPAQNTGDHEGRPYDIADSACLEPNYPNPFNAVTAIVYNLPNAGAQPAPVRLVVYNILGQEIKSLTDERQQPGRHIAYWDGTDQRGQPVASGVYFYRLEVSGIEFVKSGKMILMK